MNPSIADFNDFLKQEGVNDIPVWRQIQSLADIRNLCDHAKDREPTVADLEDLTAGVDRTIKNFH